jgi:hypothetical protein
MDYHLKPLSKACAVCEEPFTAGERVHSIVVHHNDSLVRRDISEACWDGAPDGMIAHWHCVIPEPEQKRAARLDPDSMLAYLEQLVEDADPEQDKLKYVLALFLLQKRRLKLDGSTGGESGEFLQLSGSRGEGPFEIRDQQLTEAEIIRLQAELNHCLEQEWNAA